MLGKAAHQTFFFSAIQKRKPNLKAFTIFRNSGLLHIAKPNFSNDKNEIGVACLQLIEQEAALILTLAEVALAWKKGRKLINELILKNKCKDPDCHPKPQLKLL